MGEDLQQSDATEPMQMLLAGSAGEYTVSRTDTACAVSYVHTTVHDSPEPHLDQLYYTDHKRNGFYGCSTASTRVLGICGDTGSYTWVRSRLEL